MADLRGAYGGCVTFKKFTPHSGVDVLSSGTVGRRLNKKTAPGHASVTSGAACVAPGAPVCSATSASASEPGASFSTSSQAFVKEVPDNKRTSFRVATINVDGCGALPYRNTTPASRMKQLVQIILPLNPDAILFQEVTDELFEELRKQLPAWGTFRKESGREHYYVVTFTKEKARKGCIEGKCVSFQGYTEQGRHMLVVRYGPLTLMNVHAESGGFKSDAKNRRAQLEQMAAFPHEAAEEDSTCILAGDFNMQNTPVQEESIILGAGWKDAGHVCKTVIPGCESLPGWTWKRGPTKKNYDRIFLYPRKGAAAHFTRAGVLERNVWNKLSDHLILLADIRYPVAAAHTSGTSWNTLYAPATRNAYPKVVGMARAVALAISKYRDVAARCLDVGYNPDSVALPADFELCDWSDLPTACGFKTTRPGGRGHLRRATPQDKLEQQTTYAKHENWAMTCGVSRSDFKQLIVDSPLEFSNQSSHGRHHRERGREGLPLWLRQAEEGATLRQRVLALARLQGLRSSAETLWRAVLGEEGVQQARDKMQQLLKLDNVPVDVLREIPNSWKGELALHKISGGTWIPGVFEFWLRQQVSQRMGYGAEWTEAVLKASRGGLITSPSAASAAESGAVVATPSGSKASVDECPDAFSLDDATMNLHEVLKDCCGYQLSD